MSGPPTPNADATRSLGWWGFATRPGPPRILAAHNVIGATGVGVYTGTLAIFLVTIVGLSATKVGLGLSIAGAAGFLATVPAGLLADAVGFRRFLIASSAARALVFGLYPLVGSFPTFVAASTLLALAGAGASAVDQALVGSVIPEGERVAAMASIRALRNIGFTLSGFLAGAALSIGTRGAFTAVLLCTSASQAVGALLYLRLPNVETARRRGATSRTAVFRDHRYLALTLLSTVFATTLVLLDVGIPLWVAARTAIPHGFVGVVVMVNTVLVIVLQVRVTRGAESTAGAARAVLRSGVWLALAAVTFLVTADVGAEAGAALLLAGTVLMTIGEMLESAGWWTISYELAPEHRRSEYLSAFSLNYALLATVGPALMALLVESGQGAWIVLALAYVAAGVGTTLLLRDRSVAVTA